MLLSVSNYPIFSRLGQEQTLKMIKDAGFDAVDYAFHRLDSNGEWDVIDMSNNVEKSNYIKSLLDKYGLVCNQTHAPFCFKYGDEVGVEGKKFNDIVLSLQSSAILGAKSVVVHAIKVPPQVNFTEYNLNFYKTLEPYAQKYGIKIAVENLTNPNFGSPALLNGFIRLLDSPVFCACIDVGHAELQGFAPQKFISGMDKGMIECLHIQDLDGRVDRHWFPYQGVLNWDEILKSLVDYGFDGDLNFEVTRPWIDMPEELIFPCLKYVGEIGKYMLKRIEQFKK